MKRVVSGEGMFAELCFMFKKQHFSSAVRFYEEAFRRDANLLQQVNGARYCALSAAVQATTTQGEGEEKLDEKQKSEFRNKALGWLTDELRQVQYAKQPDGSAPNVIELLRHWQQDPNLAAVRDKELLNRLPQVERETWQKLWADVDALLMNTAEGTEVLAPANSPKPAIAERGGLGVAEWQR